MSKDTYNLAAMLGSRCANMVEDLLTYCDDIVSAENLTDWQKDEMLLPVVSTFAAVLSRCSSRLAQLSSTVTSIEEPK